MATRGPQSPTKAAWEQRKRAQRAWTQARRARRKAAGWQTFELALPPEDAARLMALKQASGETLTQLIGRLVRAAEGQAWTSLSPEARKTAILARVWELFTKGHEGQKLSQREIAARLNAEGVPTISGRGGWHGNLVHDCLKKAAAQAAASSRRA